MLWIIGWPHKQQMTWSPTLAPTFTCLPKAEEFPRWSTRPHSERKCSVVDKRSRKPNGKDWFKRLQPSNRCSMRTWFRRKERVYKSFGTPCWPLPWLQVRINYAEYFYLHRPTIWESRRRRIISLLPDQSGGADWKKRWWESSSEKIANEAMAVGSGTAFSFHAHKPELDSFRTDADTALVCRRSLLPDHMLEKYRSI